MSYFNEQIL